VSRKSQNLRNDKWTGTWRNSSQGYGKGMQQVPEMWPAMYMVKQEQAEGLPYMCQKVYQVHVGQGLSDPMCTKENQGFT